MSGSGRLRRVSSVRCCGRKAFTGLSAARGRRGLAAAVAYVGGLEKSMNGLCPPSMLEVPAVLYFRRLFSLRTPFLDWLVVFTRPKEGESSWHYWKCSFIDFFRLPWMSVLVTRRTRLSSWLAGTSAWLVPFLPFLIKTVVSWNTFPASATLAETEPSNYVHPIDTNRPPVNWHSPFALETWRSACLEYMSPYTNYHWLALSCHTWLETSGIYDTSHPMNIVF